MGDRSFPVVRRMLETDIPGAVALQRVCFPPPFPEDLLWRREHLAQHLSVFPEGQLVAVTPSPFLQSKKGEGGLGSLAAPSFLPSETASESRCVGKGGVGEGDSGLVASSSSLIISEANWQAHQSWETTVGGFSFEAHDPTGATLFGADISVHPDWRGQGLAKALYQARFELVKKLGLARFGTACRIPGFAAWNETNMGGPRAYVEEVVSGRWADRTLTPLLRAGLRYVGVVQDHMEDEESGNAAAILEWTP